MLELNINIFHMQYKMPVNKFGYTDSGSTQRVISGGVTLSQANNTFLQRDGLNAATGDINLDSHKLVNVKDPANAQDAATKQYVDNSGTDKVSKSGDTITGDLKLLLDDDELRTFGISDINTGKSVSILLGDFAHEIRYNYGHPIKFAAIHGYKFTSSCGDVCKLGGSDSTNSHFYNDIIMNDKCISDLHNPKLPHDAATKKYVDTRYVRNNVGYVPDLVNNKNNNGFIVSASSERNDDNRAYNVFNSWRAEWVISDDDANSWIQLKCPEKIRIHKFAVRSIDSNSKILRWKLQASNDRNVWDDLYMGSEMANNISFFSVNCVKEYMFYKIAVQQSKSKNTGLSYWQLYTLDPIS